MTKVVCALFALACAGTVATGPVLCPVQASDASGRLALLRAAAEGPSNALDISGAWLFDVTTSGGSGTPTITFNQSGETLTGQYVGQLGEAPIHGTLKGSELSFSFDVSIQDTKLHVVYTGTATNDALKGTVTLGELGEGTFTAHRKQP
jgi:hypothetical protein